MNVPQPQDTDTTPTAHLELLRLLEEHPDYSQRQLASALGVSVGKTHYLLKALLAKGWVIAKNFRRNDQKLGYLYVLTPQGVRHRFRLTQSFLARKEEEYRVLQHQIMMLKEELASRAGSEHAQS